MPMCAMIGCSARSKSAAQKTNMEPGIGLYCLPKVITRQCGRTKALSEERRRLWLARINRKDMKNLDYVRVCGRHFISGKLHKIKRTLKKKLGSAYAAVGVLRPFNPNIGPLSSPFDPVLSYLV